MRDLTGRRFYHYRLITALGEGTFGNVYLGEHIDQHTPVAVKVLKIQLTKDTLKDFLNEARTFRLKHPHIVQLLDFGIEDDAPFLVMDYAPNGTLRQRHPQGSRLPLETIVPYVEQVSGALQYAHEMKLIHRDVKPQNILVGKNNELLLSDFGIAVIARSESWVSTQNTAGTLPYMAPEQLQGKARPASDQYALGIIIYEWLCGTLPFQGSAAEIIHQHLYIPPPSLREKIPTLHPSIDMVVQKALVKEPGSRFSCIKNFADAFVEASKQTGQFPHILSPSAPFSDVGPSIPVHLPFLPQGPLSTPYSHIMMDNKVDISKSATPPMAALDPTPGLQHQPAPPPSNDPAFISLANAEELAKPVQSADKATVSMGTPKVIKLNPATNATAAMADVGTASLIIDPLAPYVGEVGKFPPPPRQSTGHCGNPRKRPRQRWRYRALLATVLLILLIGTAVAAMNLNIFKQVTNTLSATSATVTLTPDSRLITNNYVIQGVSGTPDPNQRQIAVRHLTTTAKSDSKTVNATGHTHTPGTRASGTLTFTNSSFSSFTIAAGTAITSSNGITVITDAPAFIPAATPPTGPNGQFTVSAHAAIVGANGNIPALAINQSCCAASFIAVENPSSFIGGQDPQNYNFVQQSDVDGVANSLKNTISAQAQTSLQEQLHTGEQFVAQNGSNACSASVNTDNPIGPHGVNVNSVTVTVTATCDALAYDHAGLQTMVANLLASKANNDIGSAYQLVGQIIIHISVQDIDQQGNASLLINAKGMWVAQISDAEKMDLAKALAGKTVAQAQDILMARKDIGHVDIQANGNILPRAPEQISVVIQNVPSVQDTTTSTLGGLGFSAPANSPGGIQAPLSGHG